MIAHSITYNINWGKNKLGHKCTYIYSKQTV